MERLIAQQVAPVAVTHLPLSIQLREETSILHRVVEKKLGLPGSIANLADYKRCLTNFYRLYRPIEEAFRRFTEWSNVGIGLYERAQAGKLAEDLRALKIRPTDLEDAPAHSLPEMPSFPNALGILYVLEGSTLGAQFILPRIAKTLGNDIETSTAFFRAHGDETKVQWSEFQGSLDRYGQMHPDNVRAVLHGATAAFTSVGNWMQL